MIYTSRIYDFLELLAANNNREWFKPHKEEFDDLRRQWVDDIQRLATLLTPSFPTLAAPDAVKVFRIYRDTRFSKDKTPYKTHLSATLRPVVSGPHESGCLYLQMGVGKGYTESGLYGGIWLPDRQQLNKLRHAIVDNIEEFQEIINNPGLVEVAGTGWFSETLKKVPLGWDKDHPQAELLKLKEYGKFAPRGRDFFTRADWVEQSASIMSRFRPLVNFINYSLFEE